jgi:hypothetical protein
MENIKSLEKKILRILDNGTKIVSFNYHGTVRNVLIGAQAIAGNGCTWGLQVNRGLRYFNGEVYLVAIENYGRFDRQIKIYKLQEIENFSIL